MRIDKWIADVQAKTGVTKFMQVLMIGLVLGNIIQALNFMMYDKSVRIQLVPTEINRSFWVDGKHLSPEYLEQMGDFIIQKYASITPWSIDASNGLILKYVHPSVYGDLANRFKSSAEKIKKEGIAKHFFPREVHVSEQTQSMALVGIVETWIGDKKLPQADTKAYLVRFEYIDNRVSIVELRETNPKAPFAPLDPKAEQAS